MRQSIFDGKKTLLEGRLTLVEEKEGYFTSIAKQKRKECIEFLQPDYEKDVIAALLYGASIPDELLRKVGVC